MNKRLLVLCLVTTGLLVHSPVKAIWWPFAKTPPLSLRQKVGRFIWDHKLATFAVVAPTAGTLWYHKKAIAKGANGIRTQVVKRPLITIPGALLAITAGWAARKGLKNLGNFAVNYAKHHPKEVAGALAGTCLLVAAYQLSQPTPFLEKVDAQNAILTLVDTAVDQRINTVSERLKNKYTASWQQKAIDKALALFTKEATAYEQRIQAATGSVQAELKQKRRTVLEKQAEKVFQPITLATSR